MEMIMKTGDIVDLLGKFKKRKKEIRERYDLNKTTVTYMEKALEKGKWKVI